MERERTEIRNQIDPSDEDQTQDGSTMLQNARAEAGGLITAARNAINKALTNNEDFLIRNAQRGGQ